MSTTGGRFLRVRHLTWRNVQLAGAEMMWLLVLLLSGCAEDNSPRAVCDRRSYDDPAVSELVMQGLGSAELQMENQDALKRARKTATNKCLADQGLAPPGGVEQVIKPK